MDDARKWHVATAQLDAYAKNLPDLYALPENLVTEFHAILKLLEEATGEDLAPFRVTDSDVKPIPMSATRASRRQPGTVYYTEAKYCDRNLMLRKIDGVRGYFQRLYPQHEPKYGCD